MIRNGYRMKPLNVPLKLVFKHPCSPLVYIDKKGNAKRLL
jgi:hypothetical protein